MSITMLWTVRLLRKASRAVSRYAYHIYYNNSLPSTVLRVCGDQVFRQYVVIRFSDAFPITVSGLEFPWFFM
jgi:hypothetical protein